MKSMVSTVYTKFLVYKWISLSLSLYIYIYIYKLVNLIISVDQNNQEPIWIHSKYGNMKYMENKWLWKYENIKYGNVSYNFYTSLYSFCGSQMIFHIYIYIYYILFSKPKTFQIPKLNFIACIEYFINFISNFKFIFTFC